MSERLSLPTEKPDSGSPSPDGVLPAWKIRESSRIRRYLMTILGLQLQPSFLQWLR